LTSEKSREGQPETIAKKMYKVKHLGKNDFSIHTGK